MPTTIATEKIPADILEDLREGFAHAERLRDQAQKLQQQATHTFGLAEGVMAEVQRLGERKLKGGKQDILNLEAGTISRVVEIQDPPKSDTENPDGT